MWSDWLIFCYYGFSVSALWCPLKVLHSIWQQIWKTQQWPQDWKRSVFIPIPKKGNAKECSNYHIIAIISHAAAAAKSLQSCWTLCDPIDGSPPGSPVPGILQARTLEWVAISFSNAWKRKVKVKLLSRVRLFATPWSEAYQAPPSMGFSRQEYWSGVPLSSPMDTLKTIKSYTLNWWVICYANFISIKMF